MESAPESAPATANSVSVSSGGKMILQTVPAILWESNGCSKVVRCFFDPGSQLSFVRQSAIDELGLDGKCQNCSFWIWWRGHPEHFGEENCLLWNL